MSTIESQIQNLNWRNDDEVISFYENNRLYFSNSSIISDQEKINEILSITLRYADALQRKAHHDKAFAALDGAQALLVRFDSAHPNYAAVERQARYLRGVLLGEKKEFVQSYAIFRQLIREDPEHYYYKVWHKHTFLGLYDWIFNVLYAVGTVITLSDLLFGLSKVWPFDPGMVGVFLIAVTFISQRAFHEYTKRKKS